MLSNLEPFLYMHSLTTTMGGFQNQLFLAALIIGFVIYLLDLEFGRDKDIFPRQARSCLRLLDARPASTITSLYFIHDDARAAAHLFQFDERLAICGDLQALGATGEGMLLRDKGGDKSDDERFQTRSGGANDGEIHFDTTPVGSFGAVPGLIVWIF